MWVYARFAASVVVFVYSVLINLLKNNFYDYDVIIAGKGERERERWRSERATIATIMTNSKFGNSMRFIRRFDFYILVYCALYLNKCADNALETGNLFSQPKRRQRIETGWNWKEKSLNRAEADPEQLNVIRKSSSSFFFFALVVDGEFTFHRNRAALIVSSMSFGSHCSNSFQFRKTLNRIQRSPSLAPLCAETSRAKMLQSQLCNLYNASWER